jgi:tRNA modification GTPase
MQGEARTEFHALREEIVRCLALVEALIDFGEGEDIEEGVFEEGLSIRLFFFFLGREGYFLTS